MLRARTPLADYILPIKATASAGARELADYLRGISTVVHVIVVDGSPADVFAHLDGCLGGTVEHILPDPRYRFLNGKVDGVLTGIDRARHDFVVIADDDVRWDVDSLRNAVALLDSYDLVRPQNYFAAPMPWHARWDTARTLLNRALVGADYPGTVVVRRHVVQDGYDGDVMFENLELIRTVRARGGRETVPLDLFVRRSPPTTRQFLGQRVRQAYDSLAEPGRLALELGLLPTIVTVAVRKPGMLPPLAALSVAVAEAGRRRAGGRAVLPASAAPFAPLWLAERAVCSWLAVLARLRGGVRYRDRRIRVAAHSQRQLVRAVAEGFERGPAAAAQRDRAPARVDLRAVDVEELERSPHDQRTVGVGRDGGSVARRHSGDGSR